MDGFVSLAIPQKKTTIYDQGVTGLCTLVHNTVNQLKIMTLINLAMNFLDRKEASDGSRMTIGDILVKFCS